MTPILTDRQTLQKKLKHPTAQKNNLNFYGNRTKHTFIFLQRSKPDPKKNERVFSPTLFENNQFVILSLKQCLTSKS